MKTISISSPDDIFQQTVNALAYLANYQDQTEDNENLKLAFAKDQLIILLGDKVREYVHQQIRQQAEQQIQQTIKSTFDLIASTYPTILVEVKDE